METADGFYRCPACRRSYKSASTPAKCAVCGADGGAAPPQPGTSAESATDKFKLMADRAKGNFRGG